ncbi:MAG: hypothetical protein DMG49_26290, partial [Acidobacteria bacterium]
ITCPAGHYAGTTANNGTCRRYSYPELYNDVFWQNRSFHITVGAFGAGTLNQQHVVTLVPTLSQASSGQCVTSFPSGSYWDIGVRGDTGPTNHTGGQLAPRYSILTSINGYGGLNNSASNPAVVSQYCDGSRVPPEFKSGGYRVPPGISDATVPNPVFNLTPAATVDEGNNWINISWGPLAMTNPVTGAVLGNYAPAAGSPVVNYVPSSSPTYAPAPALDFFGNARKTNNAVDAGAIEFAATTGGGGGGGGGQGTLNIMSATNGTLASVLGVSTFTFTIPTPRAAVTSVITVQNTGTAPLQITAETLPLNTGGLYTVSANTCSSVAIGGTCSFSVTYATPATLPSLPDIGALAVVNDGTGTIGGFTPLALVAR